MKKKRQKLWIWKALDWETGQLLDWECGRRDKATLKKMIDRLMRVAAPRSHNLTDAIESLPSGLHRPKHKEHHDMF